MSVTHFIVIVVSFAAVVQAKPKIDVLSDLRELLQEWSQLEQRASIKRSTSGVSETDQAVIVNVHNQFRGSVTDYNDQPSASNMLKMYYDDEIAATAQYLADTCVYGHDSADDRRPEDYPLYVGQNIAQKYHSWDDVITAWHSEVGHFEYESGSTNGSDVGHYTQVVLAASYRVGCGFNDCDGSPIYVCNYARGQMDLTGTGGDDETVRPYNEGDTCSECEGSCSDGVCDCGDILCQNDGILDVGTCTCMCDDEQWNTNVYSGDTCEIVNCPSEDPSYCNNATYCEMYSNWPTTCPFLCGICPADTNDGDNNTEDDDNTSDEENDDNTDTDDIDNNTDTDDIDDSTDDSDNDTDDIDDDDSNEESCEDTCEFCSDNTALCGKGYSWDGSCDDERIDDTCRASCGFC